MAPTSYFYGGNWSPEWNFVGESPGDLVGIAECSAGLIRSKDFDQKQLIIQVIILIRAIDAVLFLIC